MADKSLLELPIATTASGALIYGVQDNTDKAFPANVLQGSESPQAANTVFAGPTMAPGGFPTFRPLVANDIPDLSALYMASSGGNLANATLSNSTIVGGTISGATAVFDEDKFTLRDTADTTRTGKFNVDLPTAGTSVSWTLPSTSTILVGRDTTDTLTNKKVMTVPSASSGAALRIPPGQPPTSPVNGDIWTTNAGIFVQANNTTVGPLAAETASTVNSFNGRIGAVTLLQADISGALGYTPYNPALGSYLPITGGTITGNLVVTGSLAARDVTYVGGGATNTGDKIRVSNASGTSVRIDSVNSTAASFAPMNFSASSYQFDTGPMVVSSYIRANSIQAGPPGQVYASIQYAGGNTIWWNSNNAAGTLPNADAYYRAGSHTFTNGSGNIIGAINGAGEIIAYNNIKTASGSFIGADLDHNIRIGAPGTDNMVFNKYTGTFYFRNTLNGVDHMTITASGVTASGGFGPGSDPRLKVTESLVPVDNATRIVYNLNVRKGKYHEWYNSDRKDRYFVMADQAMQHVAPEVILEGVIQKDGVSYNGWSSDQMIALLVKAMQELKDEVDELKERLNERN